MQDAQNPVTELELAEAGLAVTQAEIDLEEAERNLETVLKPDIEAARIAVSGANAALTSVRNQLIVVTNSSDNAAKLRTLEAEALWYRNNYGQAQQKFTAGEIEQQKLDWEYSNMLAAEEKLTVARLQSESSLTSAQNKVTDAEEALRTAQADLAALIGGPDALDVTRAESQVAQAGHDLTRAQEALAKVQVGPDSVEIARAESQVAQAEYDLSGARENVTKLEVGPDSVEVARAEIQVAQAEYNLAVAEEKVAELEAGPEDAEVARAESYVVQAEHNLAVVQEKLADVIAGADAVDVARAEIQVAQAEYNLAKARDTLEQIEAGPDPAEIEVSEATVSSALEALEDAREALQAAMMVAPFDGTIVSLGAEEGDLVSSDLIVVTMADLSQFRVLVTVDETDISKVEIGQPAQITFDAFPGRRFRGEVLEVPLQGRLVQNVVTYELPVSLEGMGEVPLKPGMTANVQIIVGRGEDVLLIPAMAVQQGEEGNVVLVQDDPEQPAVSTPVQVGLSDGAYAQVVRGLNEGDRVMVQYEAAGDQRAAFGRGGGSGAIQNIQRMMR